MAELGTDFGGVFDVDANMTPVSGRRCLAEAIARRWITPPGGLFYDRNYGAGILRSVNVAVFNEDAIAQRLEAEALKDERVDDIEVSVAFSSQSGVLAIVANVTDVQGEEFEFTVNIRNYASTGDGRLPAVELFLSEAA